MATTGDYIISGGQAGKSRLNVLASVLENSTRNLLLANGLKEGSAFLDVGCGGGNVATMAAEIVGKQGYITALDFDESLIALNRQDAAAQGIGNLKYHAISAYDVANQNEFDVVYARFLLSHLQRPAEVLLNMVRAAKPGGRIVVEDVQFSGHFCYPANAAFERYLQLYSALATTRGQNPEIGPALFGMLKQTGITAVGFDVIQPAFSSGAGKQMAYITMDRIKKAVISQGLATEDEVAQILSQLAAFTADEQSIISLPRIFRVWGVKA
ncbi:methyltransferase domain-containing protein [Mucilaginibacter sp. ZT4R22]|uniref:Methyltransferase domain-containing protein n=1 Tax=Mucilaginibacter pankratovii TaxID=2772110 RepID=A0ABR7WS15_9SPHI|nr:methyltransferase domain-containing protein [Mucilaginibacter pankratovii]MBD1365094.1 methyltransferase domain-containing protein [Mucilaginibacter pankratovii]